MSIQNDIDANSTIQLQCSVYAKNGLLYHHDITPYGLAINPTLQLFICTSCHTSLTSKSYVSHLKDKDHISVTADLRKRIDRLTDEHNILSTYPAIDTSAGPVPFMAGITVQYKFGCPLCMYTASKTRVRDHIRDTHGKREVAALENIPCQVLNAGGAPTNIRIIPPAPQVHLEDEPEELENEFRNYNVNSHISVAVPDDNRLISPWLLRTGFHKYVSDYPAPELVKLCSMPSESEAELASVHEVTIQYMEEATGLILKTDPLVLQLLNTREPQKE